MSGQNTTVRDKLEQKKQIIACKVIIQKQNSAEMKKSENSDRVNASRKDILFKDFINATEFCRQLQQIYKSTCAIAPRVWFLIHGKLSGQTLRKDLKCKGFI